MAGRVNGAAEEELLRSKRFSRNISAMTETELKLNGLVSPRSTANTPQDPSTEREAPSRKSSKEDSAPLTPDDDGEGDFIPLVLDKSSLPNSPDPTHFSSIMESPILGFQAQSPAPTNPQIQKLIANEPIKPIKSPPQQQTTPPVSQERKSSIGAKAKEATEALGRKLSLRSRRKNSKSHNATGSQEWKLEDIPKRKNSLGMSDISSTSLKSAIPDFPIPPSTTPLESKVVSLVDFNPTSEKSASPPASPAQFMMRNDSVSEVSTAMTPTSMTFDGKNTPPNIPTTAPTSPPIPTRHPQHHSPKPSLTLIHHSPQASISESQHTRRPSLSTTKSLNTEKANTPTISTSYISMDSRPSTAGSGIAPDQPLTPGYIHSHFGVSPQLPSIPSPGMFSFEDEISQAWLLQHNRKGSVGSLSHQRKQSTSSQTSMFSKMTNSLRHTRSISADQKGVHSRQGSKGHARNPSQPNTGLGSIILAEAEEEKAILRQRLRKSANQIVELEMKLQEDKEGVEEEEAVEGRLDGVKDALAGAEAEREMALTELKVLLKHRYGLQSDSSVNGGLQENCDKILKDFEVALDKLKDNMREQIKDYSAVRQQLVDETGRLRSLRDNYLEEAQQLNKKNDELSDLNNDIQRNMDRTPNISHSKSPSDSRGFSLFKTQHKKDSPTAGSISSVQSILFKNDLSHPMYFESKKSSELATVIDSPMSKISDSTIVPDESTTLSKAVVTRVSDQDSDLPPPPKKFNWKKNTAALKKNAVKGFKSVWSGDTNILVTSPPQSTISPPQLVSSSSHTNGLNILLQPQGRGSFDNQTTEMYKTHSFHPKAFKRWQKCGFCGDKLSGTEVRCIGTSPYGLTDEDCDYQCHTKCLMSANVACTKSRKALKDPDASSIASETSTLFGNDLVRQAEIEGRPVPYIITRCIEEVEVHGMDYEGIYRKSGGASSLRAIIDAFEAGGEVNFNHLGGSGDICAVTSALKQYLRNLPDPLLPFSAYERFLQAATGKDDSLKVQKFKAVLESLPKVNYDCLQLLMLHLSRYLPIQT
jgi:hypothetical protein